MYFDQKQEKILNFKEISAKIRQDFKIIDCLRESLFPVFNKNLISFKTALERSEEMYVPKKHKIHGQGSEKTEVNEIMKDKRATMLKQIK